MGRSGTWYAKLTWLVAAASMSACLAPPPGGQTGVGATDLQTGSPLRDTVPDVDPNLVPAPEIFLASGVATWNGQRTVSGIWVAHPRARETRPVRIRHVRTGAEIDGVVYRARRKESGDVVIVSSDTARALGLEVGTEERLALSGLRPANAVSPADRRRAAQTAEGELAARVLALSDINLLQLVAAAMRGMGYATDFEAGPKTDGLSAIRAFPRPDAGFEIPSVRVVVRPARLGAMGRADLAAIYAWLEGSGDLGVVVSVSGFADGAEAAVRDQMTPIQLLDLPGLLHIWQARYGALTPPDQALLPLEPVYFLAGQ